MNIQRDIWIDGLHYILKFQHFCFSFYLIAPQPNRIYGGKAKRVADRLFADEPRYDDVNIRAPAFKVLSWVMAQIQHIVYQYRIRYWEFSATSAKKARIYAKLLDRYIAQGKLQCSYLSEGLNFYVYPQLLTTD